MFLVWNSGIRILYTGDFSREEDRHLKSAEFLNSCACSNNRVYIWVHIHEPRLEEKKTFTSSVAEIVKRNGKCLLPVFALGRAQELLLILEEHWQKNEELKDVIIYYASSLAKKCMNIFQTYKNMMGDRVKKGLNSFIFKHIYCVKNIDNNIHNEGQQFVMASPGMLQSGLSRNLFDKWCTDSKNGIIITGYCVQGPGWHLLSDSQRAHIIRWENVELKWR